MLKINGIAHILIMSTFACVETPQAWRSNMGPLKCGGPCAAEHVEHKRIEDTIGCLVAAAAGCIHFCSNIFTFFRGLPASQRVNFTSSCSFSNRVFASSRLATFLPVPGLYVDVVFTSFGVVFLVCHTFVVSVRYNSFTLACTLSGSASCTSVRISAT
jgi:hypothetical protein